MKEYQIDLSSDLGNIFLLTHVGLQLAQEYGLSMERIFTDFINARNSLNDTIGVFEKHLGKYCEVLNKPDLEDNFDDNLMDWQKEILKREGIVTASEVDLDDYAPYVRMKLFLN